jgi:hypothetical protein
MTGSEKLLYHQIHPLKLLADWGGAAISYYLLWHHHLRAALMVQVAPAIVASAVLVRWANLEPQRQSALGRYVAHEMTPSMQALRLLGNGVMTFGAWRRRPDLLMVGLLLVLFGWFRGRLLPANRRRLPA